MDLFKQVYHIFHQHSPEIQDKQVLSTMFLRLLAAVYNVSPSTVQQSPLLQHQTWFDPTDDPTLNQMLDTIVWVNIDPDVFGYIVEKRMNGDAGTYYTSDTLARFVCQQTLTTWQQQHTTRDLKTITICDHSCGSGSILLAMFDVLSHAFCEHCIFPDSRSMVSHIVTHVLHGVDINDLAILACKMRLLIRLTQVYTLNDIFPSLEKNVRVGNSVIGFVKLPPQVFAWGKRVELIQKLSNPIHDNLVELRALFDRLYFAVSKELLHPFHWGLEFFDIFYRVNGDVLEFTGGFDLVIGNPPYGDLLSDAEKNSVPLSMVFDIAAAFVARSMDLQRYNGCLGLILTYAITFHQKWSGVRELLYRSYTTCYIPTFDRDRCRLFPAMTQSVSVLFANQFQSKQSCKFYTSEMHRLTPDLTRIIYDIANPYIIGSFTMRHRLPKIGQWRDILDHLMACPKRLGDLFQSGEPLWYRSSGNYWYNAWTYKPYQSSEIKQMTCYDHDFAIVLLNGSLFYLWMRIYGDGRHLNTDLLDAMPIPDESRIQPYRSQLHSLSTDYMTYLQQCYDPERYLFNTSTIKRFIDRADTVLCRIYGFSESQIQRIIAIDAVIRNSKIGKNKMF